MKSSKVVSFLIFRERELSAQQWISTSTPYLTPRPTADGDAWSAEAAAAGRRGTQRILEAGEVTPPAEVARLLALDPTATAVVRQRMIYLDDVAMELTDSYYPARIALGSALASAKPIAGGAVTLLAKLGHLGDRAVEEVWARQPTTHERQTFNLEPVDPVLVLTRVVFDSGDQPIQVDVIVTPASAQRLRYEIKLG